ncbi:fructose-bisphosphatase class II [Pseudonocardia sp. MH-G8]|uniref:fructose-bisphosphatase class II n=1 Tax=Pseudonocardia sp. MH-G8 TaxID=1854588 RepID=UPI000BA01B16|nr:fructose-bisphosphatase class II [Pseudonocardia sp. MH-G8]OZM75401.1 fructose-bisphosphatase class II [Pseudonocardia sp. MH-G8]
MSTGERFATNVSRGPDQALALELVRVTEAAAIAAGRWVGRGERGSGEAAATVAMYEHLMSAPLRGVVVIGRGGRSDSPVLCAGDAVGFGDGPVCDVAVSVGDGALSADEDVPSSVAAIAVAEHGALFAPPSSQVVERLAIGSEYADAVDITRPVAENLRAVAAAKGVRVSELVVAVTDGLRDRELADEICGAGARLQVLAGGDVMGAVAAAHPESAVDVAWGTAGAAEAVVAAAALSCMGGSLQVRLRCDGSDEVLRTRDLVRDGRVLFIATGVTTGELLRGVRYPTGRTTTESMVLCSAPDTAWTIGSEQRQR